MSKLPGRWLPREDRFWWYTEKGERPSDCWTWTGPRVPRHVPGEIPYGRLQGEGVRGYAHRFSYELHVAPIPEGFVIDHICRNPLCVNPDHLEPVPHVTNVRRGVAPSAINTRKTHCKRGHPFSPENVYITPKGGARQCRICIRLRGAKRARVRAAMSDREVV